MMGRPGFAARDDTCVVADRNQARKDLTLSAEHALVGVR